MPSKIKQKEKSVNTLLEASFARFGKKAAVEERSRVLSYEELNEKVESFASSLSALGMPSKSVVGIFMDGSIEYVIAILGTLKADMIFMPLNTGFPGGRLCSILKKTRPAILVPGLDHEAELRQKLRACEPHIDSMDIFVPPCLAGKEDPASCDEKPAQINARAFESVELAGKNLNDACYIITTSGSTGDPKAILGSQKGLVHFIEWEINEFGFDENARVSLLSSVTFDVSLRDILVPLAVGGTICVPGDDTVQSPAKLLQWMRSMEVTVTHLVPTLFRMLTTAIADEGNTSNALPNLEYVLLAGEPVHGSDIANWRQEAGTRSNIVNLYGPSETTLAKLFHRVDEDLLEPGETVPLGVPIPETEVLIIKDAQPCQPGEPGEIHIKTPFMSKGYYKDDELTRMHFIQNPLVRDEIDIVYKTGDQGKFSQNGTVLFLGRLDGQIKLYGRRIELEEIEASLRQHKYIRQAAVDMRSDSSGNPRLVAYIVTEGGTRLAVEKMRQFLQEKLPVYMLPHVFVNLEKLPLTHNGKVDRKALPEAERERPEMETPYLPPANGQEKILCDIWGQVLGLDRVGTRDGFFDLGGTSVLAAELAEKIRQALNVDLPIAKLFQYPSVASLSEYMNGMEQGRKLFAGLEERVQRRRAALLSRKR